MASTAPFDIGTLITCTPGVYGGEPCLAGLRFPVSMVAAYLNGDRGPDALFEDFTFLDEVRVYAAVTYYHANKEHFDRQLESDREFVENLKSEGW